MTIQLNLSTGKKIELTEQEFQEIKESLKNIKDNVWTFTPTYPSVGPFTGPFYSTSAQNYDSNK